MRASRLLSVLMLLQTRGTLSAETLARETEVSVRTIHRDIDQLSAAGVPVFAERGRSGGFRLRDGWRTRLTGLTGPEAQALFMAGMEGPAAELGLAGAATSARLKVMAALPPEWQADVQSVSTRFHLDTMDWFHSVGRTEHLGEVAQAVWGAKRLRMRYTSWQRTRWREVDPLGLVLKAGVWYLVAQPADAPAAGKASPVEPRTWRIDQIGALAAPQADGPRLPAPRGFDLAAWWLASTARFEREIHTGEATLRASPQALRVLSRSGSLIAEAIRATSAPDAATRGWRRVTIPIEAIDVAARQVLALGAEAEVLSPPALRRQIAALVRKLAARYA